MAGTMYIFSYGKKMFFLIDLSRIPLQCVRTITPKRGWGGHFYKFAVYLSTPTSTRCHCLLECGKGLYRTFSLFLLCDMGAVQNLKRHANAVKGENASRPSHVLVSALLLIGHFRVLSCLCFKTSLSAKPYFTHWVPLTTLQKLNSS